MQITWYGQSCFKIVSGQTTIILDPFSKDIGLTPPRGKADILIVSDNTLDADDHSQIDASFMVSGAGEYEVGGVHINGFSSFCKNEKDEVVKVSTMYTIKIEDITLCHLADFSKEQITEFLDKIGEVDILMIPIGGSYKLGRSTIKSLNSEKVVGVIGDIDPRVVIPMSFKIAKIKLDLEGPEKFMKASGLSDEDILDKYTVKKKDLPLEERKTVILKTLS